MNDAARKPILLWDGECRFCRFWIERWKKTTGDAVAYETFQAAQARFPQIPHEAFHRSVQLVRPDGSYVGGARAVFEALAEARGRGRLLALYRRFPPFAWLAEAVYRFIATHRGLGFTVTRWIYGKKVGDRPSKDAHTC
jgi:predicted DCC family thiol-disulfide oxidoreductase YuxK